MVNSWEEFFVFGGVARITVSGCGYYCVDAYGDGYEEECAGDECSVF
jgi:hypothetical protein